MPALTYALHGVPIRFESQDARIIAQLQRRWRVFPSKASEARRPIVVRLNVVEQTPPPPDAPPVSRGPIVVYHRRGDQLVAYFRRWGRYDIHLSKGAVEGWMTEASLITYGVFEDMIIVSLAPLLRRRGFYTIHAFAAALDDRAVVLVGGIGAGKTTTGVNLLRHGFKLLSNDSPLLQLDDDKAGVTLCAYPGLLSAYPETFSRFSELNAALALAEKQAENEKLSLAAEEIWPDVWRMTAKPGALLFPRVVPGLDASKLRPMSAFEALQALVSQSIENWDAETIPQHLRALRALAAASTAYRLDLAPDYERIPQLIRNRLETAIHPGS
ncbi:MAG: hypothetical protein GXP42_11370 [Chloroflexi bacterium]|nr:hypothetical protein [Chloroflexota bacterium]